MTAVAAASGTAIGSLYRFFPTKEVLADALLERFGARIEAGFDRLEATAAELDARALADALLARFTGKDPDRDAVLALLETRRGRRGRAADDPGGRAAADHRAGADRGASARGGRGRAAGGDAAPAAEIRRRGRRLRRGGGAGRAALRRGADR